MTSFAGLPDLPSILIRAYCPLGSQLPTNKEDLAANDAALAIFDAPKLKLPLFRKCATEPPAQDTVKQIKDVFKRALNLVKRDFWVLRSPHCQQFGITDRSSLRDQPYEKLDKIENQISLNIDLLLNNSFKTILYESPNIARQIGVNSLPQENWNSEIRTWIEKVPLDTPLPHPKTVNIETGPDSISVSLITTQEQHAYDLGSSLIKLIQKEETLSARYLLSAASTIHPVLLGRALAWAMHTKNHALSWQILTSKRPIHPAFLGQACFRANQSRNTIIPQLIVRHHSDALPQILSWMLRHTIRNHDLPTSLTILSMNCWTPGNTHLLHPVATLATQLRQDDIVARIRTISETAN